VTLLPLDGGHEASEALLRHEAELLGFLAQAFGERRCKTENT
jgi:hypothetical protein